MKKLFSLVLMGLLTATANANTVRIGSGSDGLIQPIKTADVEVPYPGHNYNDYIFVKGTPSSQQEKKYCIYKFESKNGRIPPTASTDDSRNCQTLGAGLRLLPGPVLVTYQKSIAIYEKKANEPLIIELQKIRIPQTPKSISYLAFVDLSSPQEQWKLLLFAFLTYDPQFRNDICEVANKREPEIAASLCRAYATHDPKKLAPGFIFHDDASFQSISGRGRNFSSRELRYVSEYMNSGSISVLPGTYGISWYNSETKVTTETFGIVVE